MKKETKECFFPYNEEWHKCFIEEKNKLLKDFLGEGVRIEHIGSTSIVGMEGIPIINIMKELHYFVKENNEGQRLFTVLVVKIKSKLWEQNMHQKMLLSNSEEAKKDYIESKIKSLEKNEGGLNRDQCPDRDCFLEKE